VSQLDFLVQISMRASDALESGRLQDAERLARSGLKVSPNHFLGIYTLGLALAAQGKFNEAIPFLLKSEKINSQDFSVQFNLAKTFMDSGELLKSIPHHKKAISLAPSNLDAVINFGVALFGLGRYIEVLEIFDRALVAHPDNFRVLINKCLILKKTNRYLELIDVLTKVLSLDKLYATGWNEIGIAYAQVAMLGKSIEAFNTAVSLDPKYLEAYLNLSLSLQKDGRINEAMVAIDKVIALDFANPYAWLNKGVIFQDLNDYKAALLSYEKAIEILPSYALAYSNRAHALNQLGRHSEALESCAEAFKAYKLGLEHSGINEADTYLNEAIAYTKLNKSIDAENSYLQAIFADPSHIESHVNLSSLYLERFNFEKGWNEYEWRWLKGTLDSKSLITSRPGWDGQKRNNRLFIWAEQGVGDQVLYASMLLELESYPQEIIISADKRLLPVFQRSFPRYKFIDKNQQISEDEYDEHISIVNLGRIFRTDKNDFLNNQYPYIADDAMLTTLISKRVNTPQKKICGISWKSSAKHSGEGKSISLALLAPILRNQKYDFISLQYGEIDEEVKLVNRTIGSNVRVIEDLNLFDSIENMLSLISACDIVLTTSNSTAHFAGALGKETILLVPGSGVAFWYWHSYAGKSIWYPSINVLRQNKLGDWGDVIIQAKSMLEKRLDG
jgi:tetratricopeptide (TPR) repeat protein